MFANKNCVPCQGGIPPLDKSQISRYNKLISDDWFVVDEKKLVTTAKVLFVVILAVAGGVAIKSALTSKSAIISTLESTFGSIKVKEILNIVGNIKSSIKF